MRLRGCPRAWEAEAVEDGRLGESQRVSFLRHAADCPACAESFESLGRLRQVMGQVLPPARSDFERHRQRGLLLERADQLFMNSERRPGSIRLGLRLALSLGAVVVLVAAGAMIWSARKGLGISGSDIFVSNGEPRFEVTNLKEASWTHDASGGVARVKLRHGSAEFHVHHLSEGQRFLVDLPDGEIEVRGTRFVVSVDREATQYVVVTEGNVVLRRHAEAGLLNEWVLVAGDRWDSSTDRDVPGDTGALRGGVRKAVGGGDVVASRQKQTARPDSPSRQSVGGELGSGHRAYVPGHRGMDSKSLAALSRDNSSRGGSAPSSADLGSPQAATPNQTTASPDSKVAGRQAGDTSFARGVAALRGGQYEEAEGLLRQFLTGHPHDPRSEDASFLCAVARSRMGDPRGAAKLAREYLRRFPAGMRRPEAQALSARSP